MRCTNCGGTRLAPAEYRTSGGNAPALECAKCHAVEIDPSRARTDEERDSVRLALAERAAAVFALVEPATGTGPRYLG